MQKERREDKKKESQEEGGDHLHIGHVDRLPFVQKDIQHNSTWIITTKTSRLLLC